MKMNRRGMELVCEFEGFRAEAYRDAAGVLTIGFGHTSRAGAPAVAPGMRVTRAEARRILSRDVARFASGVRSLLRVDLNDNQFSALVSFAYNVGLGNFRASSVLAAINRGHFAAVPRRLAMWVKAGGRVLPGLVRRRAAEAALFIEPGEPDGDVAIERGSASQSVERIEGKLFQKSSTNIAAIVSAAGAAVTSAASQIEEWLGPDAASDLARVAAIVIVAAAIWIIRERCLKASREGI
jgi:lysozyme